MRLLVDCGNTAMKVAVAGPEGPEDLRRVRPEPAAMAEAVAGASEIDVVAVSAGMLATLRASWGDAWGIRVLGQEIDLPELGHYPTMGHDRLMAGLAAVRAVGDCVVVDCGTATTLTAWKADGPRGARALGGLILPGAAACAAGLQRLAPDLPLVEPGPPNAPPLQVETPGAIGAALGLGYGAMVERCLEHLHAAIGITSTVATGGAARRWLPEVPYEADLVLRGLWLVVEGRV